MISLKTLTETLSQATQWKGCDWDTRFGPRKLNLRGLRSRQAIWASRATRGEEAIAWNDAARWLGEVERDARRACDLGNRAFDAVKMKQFASAIAWLREAEMLEQRHRLPEKYTRLRERVEQFTEQQAILAGNDEEEIGKALAGIRASSGYRFTAS